MSQPVVIFCRSLPHYSGTFLENRGAVSPYAAFHREMTGKAGKWISFLCN